MINHDEWKVNTSLKRSLNILWHSTVVLPQLCLTQLCSAFVNLWLILESSGAELPLSTSLGLKATWSLLAELKAATLLYRVYSHHMMTCLIFFSLTTTFKDELKPNMWLTQLVNPLRFWHSSIMINHWWSESQHICKNIHQHEWHSWWIH